MTKRRTWRWVSRDQNANTVECWEGDERPRFGGLYFVGSGDCTLVGAPEFRLFGFCPKAGECLKVEAKLVKEKK